MPSSRIAIFAGISVLVHLILIILWILFGAWLRLLLAPSFVSPAAPPSIKIVKMQPPSPANDQSSPQFIPTDPSQATSQPSTNTPLESDQNTTAKSDDKGSQKSFLPQLNGNPKAGLTYQDSPASPEVQSRPSTSGPTTQANPKSNPSAPQPVKEPMPQTPEMDTTQQLLPVDPNALPVLPPQPTPKPQQNQDTTSSLTQSPPPSPMRISKEKGVINGGDFDPGPASPETKQTELGKYKAKIYRAIGSAWYWDVDKNMTVLSIGEVDVRFFVRSNGVVDQITIINESGSTEVLRDISLNAIQKAAPFDVFSDHMKQQLGDGYWDEISFTIY